MGENVLETRGMGRCEGEIVSLLAKVSYIGIFAYVGRTAELFETVVQGLNLKKGLRTFILPSKEGPKSHASTTRTSEGTQQRAQSWAGFGGDI